jgi:hypothetical protein
MRWLKSPVISPKTLGQCKARETKWAEALLSDADQQDCADVETLKACAFAPSQRVQYGAWRGDRDCRYPRPLHTCVFNAERGTVGEGNLTMSPCDRELV